MTSKEELANADSEPGTLYAPAQFTLIRHKGSDKLHWSLNKITPFCNGEQYMPPGWTKFNPDNYRITDTYGDLPCFWCRKRAREDFDIEPEEWRHGKQAMPAIKDRIPAVQTSLDEQVPADSVPTRSGQVVPTWGRAPNVALSMPAVE